MKNIKKVVSLLLIAVLMISTIPNNFVFAKDKTSNEQIKSIMTDNNISIDNTENQLVIETELSFDKPKSNMPNSRSIPNNYSSDSAEENIENARVSLSIDNENNDLKLISYETDHNGNEQVKEYEVILESATEDGIIGSFIDISTDEKYDFNTTELQASFAFLIPVGIIIGEALLAHLISIGLAVTISGVTYIAASEFLKRNKTKNHYKAVRRDSGLFIGDGLSKAKAVSRLKGGNDTWSTSQSNAKTIAKEASKIGKVTSAEIDKHGKGKHYHYHPISSIKNGSSVRMSAHAFYGAPR
ncbi:SAR2788 family putative toxin [Peribacillus simplex]|uniref:SAR2788 family putative toxin n=1 Tax=Peribacillus TaxID=2675229 RepID=UPI00315D6FF0